jgi:hypothetical protein
MRLSLSLLDWGDVLAFAKTFMPLTLSLAAQDPSIFSPGYAQEQSSLYPCNYSHSLVLPCFKAGRRHTGSDLSSVILDTLRGHPMHLLHYFDIQ